MTYGARRRERHQLADLLRAGPPCRTADGTRPARRRADPPTDPGIATLPRAVDDLFATLYAMGEPMLEVDALDAGPEPVAQSD
ncbi:hypothetical protein ACFWP5_02395 [Streptomyces sp. NPDC058469]|uniref:hypothetical protein n=1 Tax=Streptomyces sp. NPDC058469 TaxID=3346514 RepID=UPI00365E9B8C